VQQRNDPDQLSVAPDGRPMSAQPKWRRDFPIDWPQDDYVARRDFTKFLVLTSFAFTIGQFWILMKNFVRQKTGKLPIREVASVASVPLGATVVFTYPAAHDDCILIRTGIDTFVAYSQKCTHLSCPVKPESESGTMHCPCHNGRFEMATGRPIAGPPRRPLDRVELEVRNGTIYATGVTERTA
jgi:nitrite reductase/ring-hydroxylating ferredoxin subunit